MEAFSEERKEAQLEAKEAYRKQAQLETRLEGVLTEARLARTQSEKEIRVLEDSLNLKQMALFKVGITMQALEKTIEKQT